MRDAKQFDHWCIVELMGHQRLAGRVSEQVIGGSSFVRADVPEVDGKQGLTKLFGAGAIYSLTIVDEETAILMARQIQAKPIDEWSARKMLTSAESNGADDDDGLVPSLSRVAQDDSLEAYWEGSRIEDQ